MLNTEIFRRRHLPHWDVPGATYFVIPYLTVREDGPDGRHHRFDTRLDRAIAWVVENREGSEAEENRYAVEVREVDLFAAGEAIDKGLGVE